MRILNLKSPIFSRFAIVDNEISNDISNEFGDWEYEKADIICCGILYEDEITIYFREKGDNLEEYKDTIAHALRWHPNLFAFNRNMEYGNFKGFLNESFEIGEIKAFNGKGWSKQRFFMELINDGLVEKNIIPIDPLENDSKECLDCYSKGEYDKIINHNVADLVKQMILLNNKEYLLNKYKDSLDKNGFIVSKNINR
jgi:hypothetical protein